MPRASRQPSAADQLRTYVLDTNVLVAAITGLGDALSGRPLATFAGVYRDALATARHPDRIVAGIDRIDDAALSLERFPNESLMLQALFALLPTLDP